MYAPFWLVNKTAIPLVFKQEGVSLDTAGQYEEHEVKINSWLLLVIIGLCILIILNLISKKGCKDGGAIIILICR